MSDDEIRVALLKLILMFGWGPIVRAAFKVPEEN